MRWFRLILLITSVVISCQVSKQPKIEKFVWFRHNFFRINNHFEHRVRYYLSYNDSSKIVFYGLNRARTDSIIYSKSKKIDSLSGMIYKNLYKKKLPKCIFHPAYDLGDFCTLIYQFEGKKAKCIHYETESLPDSLKTLFSFLESIVLDTNQRDDIPFDFKPEFELYKDSIYSCMPPPPPPIEQGARVKFNEPKN